MSIKNPKAIIQTLLTSYPPLTALVPAANVRGSWPDSFASLPQLTHNIVDSFVLSENYADNVPNSDNVLAEIHIWTAPGKSTTALMSATIDAMEAGGWNRSSLVELVDPDTKLMHVVMRWNKVVYR
jgi:hypothetical protein